MQRTISVMRAAYPDIQAPQWEGRRLRGFFAAGQAEGSLLHNHGEQGKVLYRYPLVQYKIVNGVPVVLAIEDGVSALQPVIVNCQDLILGGRTYSRGTLSLELEECLLGDTAEPHCYRFCTPWFGLNQKNYRQYEQAGPEERKQLLDRVLAGNLLSLSKGLGVTVERRLTVDSCLRVSRFRFKGEEILGFLGGFSVNFLLPELLGLGKSVSRGFGAVRAVPREAVSLKKSF